MRISNNTQLSSVFLFVSYLLLIVSFKLLSQTSQTQYSEIELTGRGRLVLVGETHKLQEEVYNAFKKMQKEAIKEGVSIQIVSGFRSFETQKNIWDRKYKQYISEGLSPYNTIKKIIEYTTIPGTSRHHWGTEIDIIDNSVKMPEELLAKENYEKNGVYYNLKKWMDLNSEKFGFYLVYTNSINRKGIKYEPWHYSYKKIAKPMLNQFLKIDLTLVFKTTNLKGNHFFSNDFIKRYTTEYILDINSPLK